MCQFHVAFQKKNKSERTNNNKTEKKTDCVVHSVTSEVVSVVSCSPDRVNGFIRV